MTFQKDDRVKKDSVLRRKIILWLNRLWALPVKPINTIYQGQEMVLLAVNASGYLQNCFQKQDNIFVVDSGGHLPGIAGLFGLLKCDIVVGQLSAYVGLSPVNCDLLVPSSIARSFAWQTGDKVGGFVVQTIADAPSKSDTVLVSDTFPLPIKIQRVLLMLPITFGQALIFAVPLLLNGVDSFWLGELAVLLASITLAFFWGFSNIHGALQGLILGMVAIMLVLIASIFVPFDAELLFRFSVGVVFCEIWIGYLLDGFQ